MKRIICASLLAMFVWAAPAAAVPQDPGSVEVCGKACVRAERHRERLAREMRRYHRHPLPWCTWGPESSGPPYTIPQWSMRRYRAYNASSGAAGKFQIIPSTWRAVGGLRWSRSARDAKPVIQERLARRVARAGISSQWVNC